MSTGDLGKLYAAGEVIVRQGETGDEMFVIQDGEVEIVVEKDGRETVLRRLGAGELIGEMAIFDRVARSATVRAAGEARILTVDRKNFMRRISEDPTIAFKVVQTLSQRVRELSDEVVRLQENRDESGRSGV